MAELGEEQIEYNFGRALRVALRDQDAQVRARAIEALWEDDGEDFLAYLLDEAHRDTSADVRASAVRALAHFSQLAVQGELKDGWSERLRGHLVGLAREGESSEVRRRALEALGAYSDDREVEGLIAAAYDSGDNAVRLSAVYAMGRNLADRWFETVLKELDSPVAGLRYEAAKASGAYGDRRAVPRLVERLGDDDREVQVAAIGSLGQIGGPASMTILKRLAVSKDDVVREAAEEALEEAAFMSNPIGPGGRLATDDWG
jgi:HEAT repeat protein